ncbi:hypothetical protein BsubNA05_02120 [Bacillus subtilis]|nr:hypothetical protein BsubNA05_02120 [Bacillus subtilis]
MTRFGMTDEFCNRIMERVKKTTFSNQPAPRFKKLGTVTGFDRLRQKVHVAVPR